LELASHDSGKSEPEKPLEAGGGDTREAALKETSDPRKKVLNDETTGRECRLR